MANIRLTSPLARMMFRPVMTNWDEDEWPQMTMTEGIDVVEDTERGELHVKAAVPGISAEDVDIEFEDGVLHIRAQHQESEEEKKKNKVVYRQDRVMSFDYTTTLPRPIDPKSLSAEVEDGVVTISAKLAEEAKKKKIPVSAKSKK